jgi:hypothetical protein
MTHTRTLIAIFLTGVVFRLIVFGIAAFSPLHNESGMPVSPLLVQQGIDFNFYLESAEKLLTARVDIIFQSFVDYYRQPLSEMLSILIAGPTLPAMILLSDYHDGNTLPLSLAFLLIGCATLFIWLQWLQEKGMPAWMLIIFALLPNPIWFTINISSDLPFALCVGVFYMAYFSKQLDRSRIAIFMLAVILAVFTRPNGISIFIFLIIDCLLFRSEMSRKHRLAIAGAGAVVGFILAIYLFPYFVSIVKTSSAAPIYTYFGAHQSAYLNGIFPSLPIWFDLPVSWLALLGSKVMYFVGLRPSYSDLSWWIVAARAAAGVILLPGVLYVFLRSDNSHRLFVFIFFLPIFIGPTQDRYNLAIMPLLFYFGWRAYVGVGGGLSLRSR